jgi:hypothetical protein
VVATTGACGVALAVTVPVIVAARVITAAPSTRSVDPGDMPWLLRRDFEGSRLRRLASYPLKIAAGITDHVPGRHYPKMTLSCRAVCRMVLSYRVRGAFVPWSVPMWVRFNGEVGGTSRIFDQSCGGRALVWRGWLSGR